MKKNKSIRNLRMAFVIFWVATIISFIFTIDPSQKGKNYSSFLTMMFLGNIIFGILAFLFAIFTEIFSKFRKSKLIPYTPIFAIMYVILYIAALTINGNGLIAGISSTSSNFQLNIPPSPTPIPTNYVTPTALPVQNHTYSAPAYNSDPPVLCNVNPNCGGGTTPLKKSECDNSTCCQIGAKWVFYKDKVQCGRDQANQEKGTVPANNQQSSGNNVYCWNNTGGYSYYTSSGDQCNLDNIKAATYSLCTSTQKMKVNTCDSSCSGLSVGLNGSEDFYAECLGKCTDQYAIDLKQCHY